MDFNLPRYTEYFEGTCNIESLFNLAPNEACRIDANGNKILDEDYDTLRDEWITKWKDEYNRDDSDCKQKLINKLIEEIRNTDEISEGMDAEKRNKNTLINNKHAIISRLNNSMEDIEGNFLLGEQRLLESQGLNYINNAKFYIFIALIIILLMIQLMLILL